MIETDPFRWLEEDSKDTKNWIAQHEKIAEKYFHDDTNRTKLKKRFEKLYRTDAMLVPKTTALPRLRNEPILSISQSR